MMNDEMKTTTEVSGPWECFSDPCYYDMARLRRRDGPKDFFTGFHLNTLREAQELRNILNSYEARLAPAPEEAVIKESLTTEPAPEWRELGPDEVIKEGDEVKGVGGKWFKVEQTIGAKAGECGSAIFRTRRPLPKQEGMPLEKEICMLEKGMDMGSGIPSRLVGWTEITTCLRYLRDEIQKLKEAKP
jgi:hypothetical protein